MNERILKDALRKLVKDCEETDTYCTYDLLTPRSVIELKNRRGNTIYPDTMLEHKKYTNNIGLDKDYIYVVASDAHQAVYFWNVSKLTEKEYNFKWHKKGCPKTTDFSNNRYIKKYVGYLDWDDAYLVRSYNSLLTLLR